MLPVDEVLRRLAWVRHLYDLGVEQSRHTGLLKGTCVLSFHDAAELFLYLASQHHGVAAERTEFKKYSKILRDAKPSVELQLTDALEKLNDRRIRFKHHGEIPPEHDVESLRAVVASFFELNTPIAFKGLDFNRISMIDLVVDTETRESLLTAENHIVTGEGAAAAEALAIAFAQLLDNYDRGYKQQFGYSADLITDHFPSIVFITSVESDVRDFLETARESIENLSDAVTILGHRFDYHEHLRFSNVVPHVTVAIGGGFSVTVSSRRAAPTPSELRPCLNYVIDCALRLQATSVPFVPPPTPRPPIHRIVLQVRSSP